MMPYAIMNNYHLYYEEAGAGDLLLFLHSSFSRGILSFGSQIEFFQSRYRCLFPDMREHGRSHVSAEKKPEATRIRPGQICSDDELNRPADWENRPEKLGWTTPGLADDMADFIRLVGGGRTHIVGFSLGGDVALYLAVRHPDLVRSLTLIGTTGFVTESIKNEAARFLPEAVCERNRGWFLDNLFANHEAARTVGLSDYLRHTVDNWLHYPVFESVELENIKCPVFLVAGENDPYLTAQDAVWLKERITGSRLEIVTGCGHAPHQASGKPAWFNHELIQFLKTAP